MKSVGGVFCFVFEEAFVKITITMTFPVIMILGGQGLTCHHYFGNFDILMPVMSEFTNQTSIKINSTFSEINRLLSKLHQCKKGLDFIFFFFIHSINFSTHIYKTMTAPKSKIIAM